MSSQITGSVVSKDDATVGSSSSITSSSRVGRVNGGVDIAGSISWEDSSSSWGVEVGSLSIEENSTGGIEEGLFAAVLGLDVSWGNVAVSVAEADELARSWKIGIDTG